jgi:hypothetical protein
MGPITMTQTTGKELFLLLGYREQYNLLVKTMEAYLVSREFDDFERHSSHGLYYDVINRGRKFMFDLSPEDVPHNKREPGLLVIRDIVAHHWESPTRIGAVNIFDEGFEAQVDRIIGVTRA